jgi:cyclopropane fatty-acyl-phospholipid synthase-like methyltransferase
VKRPNIDNQRDFDWGKTSKDYGKFRPGYPESFFDIFASLGVGREGQRILDLGTGTGVLARAFARRGAEVTGVDIAENQIEEAKRLAAEEGLSVEFTVCPTEEIDFPDATFDAVTAGQSWLYFDQPVVILKVLSTMQEEGYLALTHFSWLPFKDEIARRSEELVLKHNPNWNGAGYRGTIPAVMPFSEDHFDLKTFHLIEEPIPFTRESWRGRFRACRGIGASLSSELVERFDSKHEKLLRKTTSETFTVLHQMSIHVFMRKGMIVSPPVTDGHEAVI